VFGVSMWELALILVVALIVLGPRQLTETAKVVGRLYRELQRMTSDLRGSIDLDLPSSSNSYNRPPSYQPPPQPLAMPDSLEQAGKKTGPDFYAELLEKSDEEEKQAQSGSQNPPEANEQQAGAKAGEPVEKTKT
jgi:Sec-independent protein translocase protein TatA